MTLARYRELLLKYGTGEMTSSDFAAFNSVRSDCARLRALLDKALKGGIDESVIHTHNAGGDRPSKVGDTPDGLQVEGRR